MACTDLMGKARDNDEPKSAAALKQRIADLDKQMDLQRETYEKDVQKAGKGTPEAQKLEDEHRAKIKQMKDLREDLSRKLAALDKNAGPDLVDEKDIKAVQKKIADVNQAIDDERDRYEKQVAKLQKGSDDAQKAEDEHDAKLKALRAQKYMLMKKLAALKEDRKDDAKELRALLAQIDEQIKEENDRHADKVKSLEGRRQRAQEQLDMIDRPRALAAQELKTKIADLDKRLAEEDQSFAQRVKTINDVKHRIFVARQQNPTPQQDYELRQRMSEQDSMLATLRQDHARRIEELQAYKAHLEAELEKVENVGLRPVRPKPN
jgi:chromosome segregation ATPase